jgi:hypothetical protein
MEATITGAGLALTGVLLLGWVVYRQSVGGMIARAVPVPEACPSCHGAFEAGRPVTRCSAGHLQHRDCVARGAPCPVPDCSAPVS